MRESFYERFDGLDDTFLEAYAADRELPCKGVALIATAPEAFYEGSRRKRPSIHMPRWASRITLEITDVRVERLQEISEADAMAEGIGRYANHTFGLDDPGACMGATAVMAYMRLWNHINGQESWATNPLVWVLTFKRLTP